MKSAARTHRHGLGGGVEARLDQAGLHERDVEIDAMREFHEAVVGYDHDDGRGVALARCGDQPSQHFVDALEILVGCSAERSVTYSGFKPSMEIMSTVAAPTLPGGAASANPKATKRAAIRRGLMLSEDTRPI